MQIRQRLVREKRFLVARLAVLVTPPLSKRMEMGLVHYAVVQSPGYGPVDWAAMTVFRMTVYPEVVRRAGS
jgi:hypothetical protein